MIGFFVFTSLVWGILYGRFQFEVTHNQININKFPSKFDQLKVVQISDIHLGVFPNHENELEIVVDSVNKLKPDLIFVTGDFINSFSEEISPFVSILKKMKATYGVYAVLGNHDYGDYFRWHSAEEKQKNHLLLLQKLQEAGMVVLNNSNIALKRENDTLYIAGIENWGEKPYRQEGDLNKAIKGISEDKKVLLLSHDPVFWGKEVLKHSNICFTFSGHTHGMQLGLRFMKKEYSPFGSLKKEWKGLYEKHGQYLYVNKGISGSYYCGRVGIRPEITEFVLSSNQK